MDSAESQTSQNTPTPRPILRKTNTWDSLGNLSGGTSQSTCPILKKTNTSDSLGNLSGGPPTPRPILRKTNTSDSLGNQSGGPISPPILKKTGTSDSLRSQSSERSLSPGSLSPGSLSPKPMLKKAISFDSLTSQTDKDSRRSMLKGKRQRQLSTSIKKSLSSLSLGSNDGSKSSSNSSRDNGGRKDFRKASEAPDAGAIPLPSFAGLHGPHSSHQGMLSNKQTPLLQDTTEASLHRRRRNKDCATLEDQEVKCPKLEKQATPNDSELEVPIMQNEMSRSNGSGDKVVEEDVRRSMSSSQATLQASLEKDLVKLEHVPMMPVQFSQAVANHEQIQARWMQQMPMQMQMQQYYMQVATHQYQLMQWQRFQFKADRKTAALQQAL